MSGSQQLTFGGSAQPAPPTLLNYINYPTGVGPTFYTNSGLYSGWANLYPGNSDWCWEAWINPAFASYYSVGTTSNAPACLFSFNDTVIGSNLGLYISSTDGTDQNMTVTPQIMGSNPGSSPSITVPYAQWTHVCMNRQGSVINTFINGQLNNQSTGIVTVFDTGTVGGANYWLFGGPLGDRDAAYPYPYGGNVRSLRYVIGSSVYGSANFTPPALSSNITQIVGTQYMFVPTLNTALSPNAISDSTSPTAEFYNYVTAGGNGSVGLAQTFVPGNQTVYPPPSGSIITQYPYYLTPTGSPSSPYITTNLPGASIPNNVTSAGNFTMTGANVGITSTANLFAIGNSNFTILLWFYVPANITNEMKTVIYNGNNGTAGGLVVQLGRVGMGIDWLCISESLTGAELSYGQHVWARGQWNNVIIQRNGASGGSYSTAWAGAIDSNWLYQLNLSNSGLDTFIFNNTSTTSTTIGCAPGSTVSCELLISQIWLWGGLFYSPNLPYVPVQNYNPFNSYSGNASFITLMQFFGTEGSTEFIVTPNGYAPAWTNVTATVTGPTSVSINATPPPAVYSSGYGYNYVQLQNQQNGIVYRNPNYSYPATFDGLVPGQRYTFTTWTADSGYAQNCITSAVSNGVTPLLGGQLFTWGQNNVGQLGLGNTTNTSSPVQVGAGTTWANNASGYNFGLMVDTTNKLWAWGDNTYGVLGQGNTTSFSSPVQVGALTNWLWVAAGQYHVVASKTDGTLWAWGYNASGQLGLGDVLSRSSPVQVGVSTNWQNVAANSNYSVALGIDGTIWSWGANNNGQLGLGDTSNRSAPVQIGTGTSWTNIEAGFYHAAALRSDYTLWMWGANNKGQLGLGNTAGTSSPVQTTTYADWSAIAVSGDSSIGVRMNGSLWSWGLNSNGQLGQGNTTDKSTPTQVGALNTWEFISIGGNFGSDLSSGVSAFGIKLDGTLWAWGLNNLGQLGLGNTTNTSSPVQVGAGTLWYAVSAGDLFTSAVQQTAVLGTPPSWNKMVVVQSSASSVLASFDPGYVPLANSTVINNNSSPGTSSPTTNRVANISNLNTGFGYIFNGETTNTSGTQGFISLEVGPLTLTGAPSAPLNPVATTTGTTSASVAFSPPSSSGGSAITSYTVTSSPGSITGSGASSPVTVTGLTQGTDYTFTVTATNGIGTGPASTVSNAIIPNGTLYSWGTNTFGQVGIGTHGQNYSAPQQVPGTTPWLNVASTYAYSGAATQPNSSLWTWGRNDNGELGLSSAALYTMSPQQVGAQTTWKSIAFGGQFALALKTDGTIWAWGNNLAGQLGQGNTTSFSSPVQVGVLTSWIAIAAGRYSSYGVRSNGSLWGWGSGNNGGLGQGDNSAQSLPVQISFSTNWAKVYAGGWTSAFAIQNDGTLWAWGLNNAGQLGLGDTTSRSLVAQVGVLTNWVSVCSGGSSTTALKPNGSLWGWGSNGGQLGLGTTTSYSSPVQIGVYTGWQKAGPGFGIKGDGTLWTWGTNAVGQLGLGNTTGTSSPQQVGAYRWSDAYISAFAQAIPLLTYTGIPTVPTNVTATVASNTTATVTWTPSSFPTASYTVTASPGGATQTSNGATMTFTGLAAGQAYTFTVTATNKNGTSAASAASNSVVTFTGALYAVGNNTYGQLGNAGGNTGTLTQIGALTNWLKLAAGQYHSAGVNTSGALFTWGRNNAGQLGQGNTTNYSSPKQVGALTTWTSVSCGRIYTVAVKNDGTIWSWGDNTYGQLGLGNKTNYSSPKQIGGANTWSSVSAGVFHVLALKSGGTLWAWGYGALGQLGQYNTTSYSSPKQVGTYSNWLQVSAGGYFSTVLNNTGQLQACGSNASGELGIGNIGGGSVFLTPLGGTWSEVSAGASWAMGIQTNGTLWAWGSNSNGQLGQGNNTSSGLPVQVGALTSWVNLAQGSSSISTALATQTQSTLWVWGNGYSNYGNSPVQVGVLTSWASMAVSNIFYLAVRGQ